MADFLLVRHGEPDYDAIAGIGFFGFGRALAPLTEEGVRQVGKTAEDTRLLDAEFIVSSPYTRALQTAAILAGKLNKKVIVEPELHEWIADKTNHIASAAEADVLFQEFHRFRGEYPADAGEKEWKWETVSSVRARVRRVADKYASFRKVILVGHGIAFRTLTDIEKMAPAQIIECHYEKGQPDCEYHFLDT